MSPLPDLSVRRRYPLVVEVVVETLFVDGFSVLLSLFHLSAVRPPTRWNSGPPTTLPTPDRVRSPGARGPHSDRMGRDSRLTDWSHSYLSHWKPTVDVHPQLDHERKETNKGPSGSPRDPPTGRAPTTNVWYECHYDFRVTVG